jgi:ATP-dependent DNA ligase
MAEGVHLLFYDGENYDCPDRMKTIFGHSVDKSLAWQEKDGQTDFEIFNVLFWDGEQLKNTWQERMDVLRTYVDVDEYGHQHIHVVYPEVFTHKDAMAVLQECPHYEGYVIWHLDHTDMPIKWGGAPSRKAGCWKLKNFKEADVLIYKWETGKGKLNNDVATLSYGVYDKDGNIVHMGRGGSGLDEKKRGEIRDAVLPLVCELKYEEITKAEFRLPVILRVRDDKAAVECTKESLNA